MNGNVTEKLNEGWNYRTNLMFVRHSLSHTHEWFTDQLWAILFSSGLNKLYKKKSISLWLFIWKFQLIFLLYNISGRSKAQVSILIDADDFLKPSSAMPHKFHLYLIPQRAKQAVR